MKQTALCRDHLTHLSADCATVTLLLLHSQCYALLSISLTEKHLRLWLLLMFKAKVNVFFPLRSVCVCLSIKLALMLMMQCEGGCAVGPSQCTDCWRLMWSQSQPGRSDWEWSLNLPQCLTAKLARFVRQRIITHFSDDFQRPLLLFDVLLGIFDPQNCNSTLQFSNVGC